MTRSNERNSQDIVPPPVDIEQTQPLSEIYEQEYPEFNLYPDGKTDGKNNESAYKGRESLNRKIRLHKNSDITNLKVDAVVNPVQTDLTKPAVGLCLKMFYKGGPMLKQACLEYASCLVGEAFITEGYELPAQYVIHTAGPSPNCRLKYQERLDYLRQSYLSCLSIIREQEFKSVGIPCLGTGRGGVKLDDGVKIAVATIRDWLDAGNNKLEHLVFCLYDDQQYKAVMKEMLSCFPRGKDAAGVDLEQLQEVPDTVLNPPAWIQRTHIFSLKYNPAARVKICHHFQSLVNHCHRELSPPDIELDRYRDCAVFSLTPDRIHRCIILHSHAVNMVEIQILKFCHDNSEIDQNLKIRVYSAIKDYLEAYLENVTPFDKYVRCEKSSWKSEYGVWPCSQLQVMDQEIPCDHGNNMADTHMIRPIELLNQWPDRTGHIQQIGTEGGYSRPVNEPIEHLELESIEKLDESTSHSSMLACFDSKENTQVKDIVRPVNNKKGTTSKTSPNLMPGQHKCVGDTGNFTGQEIDAAAAGNSFVSFTHSLETEVVRPKENNIPNLRNTERSATPDETSSNSPTSLSSKIFSSLQSLFSSKSDSKQIALQNSYDTNLKRAKSPVENSISSESFNQAMRAGRSSDTSFKENEHLSSDNFFNYRSHNTIEKEIIKITGTPEHDLQDKPPHRAESKAEVCRLSQFEKNFHSRCSCSSSSTGSSIKSRSERFDYRYPTDKDLLEIAESMGLKHEELGIRLGLPDSMVQRHKGENPYNLKMQGYHILKSWFRKCKTASLDNLFYEMDDCDIDTCELRQKFSKLLTVCTDRSACK